MCCLLVLAPFPAEAQVSPFPDHALGYRDFSRQAKLDQDFLAIPDPKLAQEELKTLTAVPHVAASKEDYDTALYVAGKFKAAGLDTQIVPYKAWLNLPQEVFLEATNAEGKILMTGPTREHVDIDAYQDDPRVLPAFNGSSPACDLTAEAVYANYGRPEDFKRLDDLHISVAGKIVLVRYGMNFRGVKVYLAQQRGAAGVIIYSDPADDGYFQGDKYPHGPWRPDTGVQRGSVQYMFKYPGDATTPDVASTPALPASKRLPLSQISSLPTIPSMPLSYRDAAPILENLGGPVAPREWQGALPFSYHVGGGGLTKIHMRLKMDYAQRTVWDVIGKVTGSELPDEWVVAGNHRDAWVYGAVDPSSGTTAMLEAVHGIGSLLAQGWKPRRTLYFCSWDAEEEGLIGSTEWAEEHAKQLAHAVAYINTDASVSGVHFEASAVPSLKQFIREVTMEVASPKGGSVYDEWKKDLSDAAARRHPNKEFNDAPMVPLVGGGEVRVGDLGSGSDYTPFIQHLGVPSTDISSTGPYGVYHSVFDNYSWFVMNADPTFVYEQQMARVFGLEVLHMADTDVLPYDYVTYAKQIQAYLFAAQARARDVGMVSLDFDVALGAASRFAGEAMSVMAKQLAAKGDTTALNASLRAVESDLLAPEGLPGRTWFRHTIFAPGEYTGYAAVVVPGVNEAIDARDAVRAQAQMANVTAALVRATETLESVQ
ncbi:MAG: N-acetylated-alpha-linked acidic dipeptidase [Acidobacteriaceae bacterium]|nr:N-acetylated-alpha-linked acidic dipeptidase [Acidobacteriaceae bacterium]